MENGFDRVGFMAYLEKTFNGFENSFLRNTIDNIIDYGLKHERISKDQFCFWLTDMIPEIEFGEVAMFIDDGSLTKNGQNKKHKALQKDICPFCNGNGYYIVHGREDTPETCPECDGTGKI